MVAVISDAGSRGRLEVPDCLPIVGNLDEVAATVVLLACLRRLGFDAVPSRR